MADAATSNVSPALEPLQLKNQLAKSRSPYVRPSALASCSFQAPNVPLTRRYCRCEDT